MDFSCAIGFATLLVATCLVLGVISLATRSDPNGYAVRYWPLWRLDIEKVPYLCGLYHRWSHCRNCLDQSYMPKCFSARSQPGGRHPCHDFSDGFYPRWSFRWRLVGEVDPEEEAHPCGKLGHYQSPDLSHIVRGLCTLLKGMGGVHPSKQITVRTC